MAGASRGNWFTFLICAALPPAAPADSSRYSIHTEYSPPAVFPAPPRAGTALVAIIIDDLGEQYGGGLRAVNLPGAVACAFLPHTRHGEAQAEFAHSRGKEVLLHLPLQPGETARRHPVGLGLRSGRAEMAAYLAAALDSVPHARGINNHQGSLLTEMPEHMNWLMREIKRRPHLYFVDSRTSTRSIAYRMARARAVPAAERQVFLDSERGAQAVQAAFHQLIRTAQRDGFALGIGHPYPETFAVLEAELPRLAQRGIELVAPSVLIAAQSRRHGGGAPYYKRLKLSPELSSLVARTTGPGLLAARSAAVR